MFKRKKSKSSETESTKNWLELFKPAHQKPVAKVILNGYNIEQQDSFRRHGAMCSFKIMDGDLWDEWHNQSHLTLRTTEGKEATIKVAALPVEDDSYGLIEFL